MLPFFTENSATPHSQQHAWGWDAHEAVDARTRAGRRADQRVAGEIIFTSGATESNNLALKARSPRRLGAEPREGGQAGIVTVATEHKSVLDVCQRLGEQGST